MVVAVVVAVDSGESLRPARWRRVVWLELWMLPCFCLLFAAEYPSIYIALPICGWWIGCGGRPDSIDVSWYLVGGFDVAVVWGEVVPMWGGVCLSIYTKNLHLKFT